MTKKLLQLATIIAFMPYGAATANVDCSGSDQNNLPKTEAERTYCNCLQSVASCTTATGTTHKDPACSDNNREKTCGEKFPH